MKLRIKGNSLRLRVTRPELTTILEGGRVEETVRFGPRPADQLAYVLQVEHLPRMPAADDGPVATFAANEIRIALSPASVRRWREPDQVGIEGRQPVGGGETLHLLIEKDFACIDGPPGSEDPDAFPNPSTAKAC